MKALQRSLFALAIGIGIEMTLGAILLEQYGTALKMAHGAVGLVIAFASGVALYFAFRETHSAKIRTLSVATTTFIVLAIVGGKLAGVDYENGLMLMRGSAATALLLTIISLFVVKKHKN